MQEVTRQLGPLTDRVGVISNNFERLFSTNGGPKGFLQTEGEKTDGRMYRSAASSKGAQAVVSDAATPTYNATYASGGAVTVPVICDGANWKTH